MTLRRLIWATRAHLEQLVVELFLARWPASTFRPLSMLIDRDRVRVDRVINVRDVLWSASGGRLEASAILADAIVAGLLPLERSVLVHLTRLVKLIVLVTRSSGRAHVLLRATRYHGAVGDAVRIIIVFREVVMRVLH